MTQQHPPAESALESTVHNTAPVASPHLRELRSRRGAIGILIVVCALFWGDALFGGRVLLPGDFLRGFAPFGSEPNAPWTILKWDALAQYFPWRHFAGEQIRGGTIPLWNPHQFSGAPFLANGQSAVFYIGSLLFWLGDVARAFGIAAFAHSLLAALGAFALLQRWKLSIGASLFGALAWALSGYFAAWNALPTLAHTASWLPLLLWLFERASEEPDSQRPQVLEDATKRTQVLLRLDSRAARLAMLALALCSSLLAGHAQVFAFLVLALVWRALTLDRVARGLQVLAASGAWALALSALQLLPTLELARLGHRAGAVASEVGWRDISQRALQPSEVFALFLPSWPMAWGSLNESFPFVGATVLLFSILGAVLAVRRFRWNSPLTFALGLAILGLGTALAWAPSRWAYFGIPGAAQLGGAGRALVLWSLGAALLGAFALDAVGRRFPTRAPLVALVVCLLAVVELNLNGWDSRETSAREPVYPRTELTSWLRQNLQPGERVLFETPRTMWQPREQLQSQRGRSHPPGVLPPNGAMVYGIDDVGGYDSLAPLAYRNYLNEGEGRDVAPLLNGNIALPSPSNTRLDELNVRYVVTLFGATAPNAQQKVSLNNCTVWERRINPSGQKKSGADFSPGFRDGKYQPQSFRLGAFVSLCALAGVAAALAARRSST